MAKPKSKLEIRLAQLKKEVPTRGFERYPSLLRSVYELPVELQSSELTTNLSGRIFKTIIAFPPQIQHGWNYVPKQALLFTMDEVIHILASIWPDQPPQVTIVKNNSSLLVRLTLLLLYGFLEIVAQGEQTLVRINIEFNTVAWSILSGPLEQFLSSTVQHSKMPDENIIITPSIGNAILKLPYKFSNGYYLYGKLPNEALLGLAFQPIAHSRWWIFDRRAKLVNSLLLLTSNFFIVMQEDVRVKLGWIISFIPRSNILLMRNNHSSQWNELTIHIERNGQQLEQQVTLKNEITLQWAEIWVRNNGKWEDKSAVTVANR
jgi:hypothetical protein